jgi:hypothetical protein
MGGNPFFMRGYWAMRKKAAAESNYSCRKVALIKDQGLEKIKIRRTPDAV